MACMGLPLGRCWPCRRRRRRCLCGMSALPARQPTGSAHSCNRCAGCCCCCRQAVRRVRAGAAAGGGAGDTGMGARIFRVAGGEPRLGCPWHTVYDCSVHHQCCVSCAVGQRAAQLCTADGSCMAAPCCHALPAVAAPSGRGRPQRARYPPCRTTVPQCRACGPST